MSTLTLTADDLLFLAGEFRRAASAVGDYLYDKENHTGIDTSERIRLQALERTLVNISADLNTESMARLIENSEQTVVDLKAVTAQARTALSKIDNAKAAIGVVAALIGFGAALASGSGTTIVATFRDLKDALPDKNKNEPAVNSALEDTPAKLAAELAKVGNAGKVLAR